MSGFGNCKECGAPLKPKYPQCHPNNVLVCGNNCGEKKEYWVDVRFTVLAEDGGDAASIVHDFVPDVEDDGAVVTWTLADSLVVEVPDLVKSESEK